MTTQNSFNHNSDSNGVNSVAFIGLGAMGYRMAAHLPKQFANVRVYNRTVSKADEHAKQHGTSVASLAQAAGSDVVFSCLPTSYEVSQIIDDLLAKNAIKTGTVWVDCTSGVPEMAKILADKLHQVGAYFIDAPVSGQTIGAENGTLTVMVGGDAIALKKAYPAIDCFAELIEHVGSSGAGFAVKAINNMLLAVNLWAAGEGLSVLKAHGVNLSSALNCINASSGMSLASQNIIPNRVLNRTFPNTFALDLLAKDCGIAQNLQQQKQLPTPVLAQVASLVRAASNQHQIGLADFSQLVTLLESFTGIELD